mmetsp:Transcript_67046/g.146216  ORF Transcript_67046/g.146216 Transcript_67046/m.146216 type:complete len:124 (+) Transcript_67046:218-589(+)
MTAAASVPVTATTITATGTDHCCSHSGYWIGSHDSIHHSSSHGYTIDYSCSYDRSGIDYTSSYGHTIYHYRINNSSSHDRCGRKIYDGQMIDHSSSYRSCYSIENDSSHRDYRFNSSSHDRSG